MNLSTSFDKTALKYTLESMFYQILTLDLVLEATEILCRKMILEAFKVPQLPLSHPPNAKSQDSV